jgi:hypothetical protein
MHFLLLEEPGLIKSVERVKQLNFNLMLHDCAALLTKFMGLTFSGSPLSDMLITS